MPSTPLKPTSRADLNHTPTEPWSRKTPSRFSGVGSYVVKREGRSPTGGTPQKGTPKEERYLTQAERAQNKVAATSTPTKPSAVFASVINRFDGHGAVYTERDLSAPAVGTYDSTAHVADGASAGTTAGFRAPTTSAGERFAGLTSIYGSSTPGKANPGVGEYNPARAARAGGGGEGVTAGTTAAFKDETDRFQRHDGIYKQAMDVAATNSPLPPSASPATLARAIGLPTFATNANVPKRDQTTAAFRANGDRFEALGSVYYAQAFTGTPGAGAYDPDSKADLSSSSQQDSSFASSTDRFQLPNGLYTDQPGGASPAVSAYEASKAYDATQVARVRGAVKLQAAVRRRQSRGIFAQFEAESSQVPGPGHYAPELLPQLAKAKRPAPAASEVELANAATKALLASTLNTLDEATAALESLAVDEGEEKSADAAAAEEEAEEQQAAPASPPLSPLRSGAMLSQQIAPSPLQMPSAIKLPAEAAYVPSPAAYERLSSAPLLPRLSADADELAMSPVVREPPKGRLSRVVSLDMWLAEMDDDDTNGMASVREEGEEELEAAPLSDEVLRKDYFDESSGWDLDGLRSDIALYMAVEVL